MGQITFKDFEKIDIRTGTIVNATHFEGARKPALKLEIDFGPAGILRSSAQITHYYKPEMLIGKQIVAVINFPEKQIGSFFSQCLVLGAVQDDGSVILLEPEIKIANGLRIS